MSVFTHTCHTCHTNNFECLEYRLHTHIEHWIFLHTQHAKMSSSWISPAVYHENKIGKSLRCVLRCTFTQQTHTHTMKKLRRLYFYHTVFRCFIYTTICYSHAIFFSHASIVCLYKELRVVVITFVKIEDHRNLKKNCLYWNFELHT